jgi:tetratricopeptide (TPR) repeat protein
MSYRVWILLLLLATNCYSQDKVRPSDRDKSSEFNPGSQLMRSLSRPTNVRTYSAPEGPGKLSVEELRLPPKAVHELKRSEKAYQLGDWRGSAAHLEKVLVIGPQYWPAHIALGKLYVSFQEYDRAVEEFKKASASEPLPTEPLKHLSATLYLLGRYPEAESVARSALMIDPSQMATRYILGCALAAQERFTTETVEQLRQSSSQIPNARLVLASVLYRMGTLEEATAELHAYLEVPDAPGKDQAQSWLALLSHKTDNASRPGP